MDNDNISSHFLKLTLIVACFTVIFALSADQSSAATINVGPNQTYTSINSGIAASNAGDTIIVHNNPSNYSEQVVVNKVGLKIGVANGDNVTVQTTGSGIGFSINNVNNVTISGFTIQGNDHTQGTGISLSNANYCSIINNVINSYRMGVSVTGSNNNISNNSINNNTMGVGLTYPSNNNTISYNNITNPTYNADTEVRLGIREDGFYFGTWTPNQYNKYLNNDISNVNEGIFIQQGTNFNISGNKIAIQDTYNYPWAITLSVGNTANQVDILINNSISSEGKINSGSRGIYLISNPSSPANANMQIYSNNIANFWDGIYSILYTPTGSSITQLYLNRFYNNTHGLSIASSTDFNVINNWWGKNSRPTVYMSSPPASYDIFDDQGTVTYDPWIVLNINANPSSISAGYSSVITADLTKNSNNQDTSSIYPGQYLPDGIPVNFNSDSLGSVNPGLNNTINGITTTTFNSGNLSGASIVSATTDAQTVSGIVNIIGTQASTAVVVNPLHGVTGSVVNLVATLNDTLNNIPINNKSITFSVGGNVVGSALTNSLGVATLPYNIILNIGNYTILAVFSGDSTYMTSSNTNILNVGALPVVTSTDPVNNSVNVALNKVIKINYNKGIKFTATPSIILKTAAGTIIASKATISASTLTITPNTLLAAGTQYLVVVNSNSITDLDGVLAGPYSFKFTTDTVPVVTSTVPVNNSVNVPLNKVIKINYNKPIKFTTTPWIEILTSTGKVIASTATISGSTLTITPKTLLVKGMSYTIAVHSNSISSLLGALAPPYVLKFKT